MVDVCFTRDSRHPEHSDNWDWIWVVSCVIRSERAMTHVWFPPLLIHTRVSTDMGSHTCYKSRNHQRIHEECFALPFTYVNVDTLNARVMNGCLTQDPHRHWTSIEYQEFGVDLRVIWPECWYPTRETHHHNRMKYWWWLLVISWVMWPRREYHPGQWWQAIYVTRWLNMWQYMSQRRRNVLEHSEHYNTLYVVSHSHVHR